MEIVQCLVPSYQLRQLSFAWIQCSAIVCLVALALSCAAHGANMRHTARLFLDIDRIFVYL